MAPKRKWKLTSRSRNVHEIEWNLTTAAKAVDVLLISDAHWDNPMCIREKLEQDCKEAIERDAPIISIGDFFCAMQGKFDKRSSKDSIRPEHAHGDYLDRLVTTAADWHEPYKSHFAIHGLGNHETSIRKHHETDLIERLTSQVQARGGIAQPGGYGGWVRFKITISNRTYSIRLYYHHGFGGGGPVTQGAIDWSRYLMHAEADIYAAGHIHYANNTTMMRAELTAAGQVQQRKITFVRCSTYKDEYADGFAGFHVESGRGPRPIGGYWLSLKMNDSTVESGRLTTSVTDTVQ